MSRRKHLANLGLERLTDFRAETHRRYHTALHSAFKKIRIHPINGQDGHVKVSTLNIIPWSERYKALCICCINTSFNNSLGLTLVNIVRDSRRCFFFALLHRLLKERFVSISMNGESESTSNTTQRREKPWAFMSAERAA
ncbi:hypothetical protein AC579_5016 [Pseudocercospora musae]|uniref:Uncharacterized protein n=1 Tax=Pseudocercospora musae TaxID=113226 RepID=A0A139I8D2_9PEZI|nr:hypothetical protein AC579_5016 [Pseudocercospora musae]